MFRVFNNDRESHATIGVAGKNGVRLMQNYFDDMRER
jgi:hypothetical protein